ncbi:MAG: rRNA pseudouridine synthase [Ignavibacteriae bacterium]|nr:rRNA pseudouridine synthase [Ignavibacteriota bacterium]MCB9217266.1 rRNA pseudouridine synthase [Ignavibacteria bacterium]
MKTQTTGKNRQTETAKSGIRLNKVLADAGVTSRRGADEMIAAGRVKVNGNIVRELGTRVVPADRVTVDGKPIQRKERLCYILLNKPKDTITTTQDEKGRRTVVELVDVPERLYPVGRLDRATTGVLLLTNDGELAYRMTHPRYEVEREYRVQLDRPIEVEDARRITEGVDIGMGESSQPCQLFLEEDRRNVVIILKEGKNREVRRIFKAFNYEVKKLHRLSYGGLVVTGIRRGEWRELNRSEVRDLRQRLKLPYAKIPE